MPSHSWFTRQVIDIYLSLSFASSPSSSSSSFVTLNTEAPLNFESHSDPSESGSGVQIRIRVFLIREEITVTLYSKNCCRDKKNYCRTSTDIQLAYSGPDNIIRSLEQQHFCSSPERKILRIRSDRRWQSTVCLNRPLIGRI